MSEAYSLYELNQLIKSVLDSALPETFLVTAEIASCDVKNHCYLTLVEKDENTIIAEMRAIIWSNRYQALSPLFRDATGVELSKGIKILFQASVSFHERYGLKLIIENIDPSYTIGELAIKRKEILERLTKEGLRDRNKLLEFPLVPQRIGIISSSTAAGYEDLISHLKGNPYGYSFSCTLYEALMQGERAEESIVQALQQCLDDVSRLDVVIVVRGGGGKPDLHCFDSYAIGRAIALLPIPVISGIGHERDITITDEVSNIQVKTPTAAADLIITRIKEFEDGLDELTHRIRSGTQRLTSDQKESFYSVIKNFESAVRSELLSNSHRLQVLQKGLMYAVKLVRSEREKLRSYESNINHLNPRNILKRGYSITYSGEKALKSISDIHIGDSIKTVLFQGEVMSRVENKKKRVRKKV
ncbi:MAG: exodeoxyribonuclease VII large subunit [Nitrospiraceae bacterium]|nr:MAG: exodeoxyribonuclease VII large subunit [Nitrospiraceae bacterium]